MQVADKTVLLSRMKSVFDFVEPLPDRCWQEITSFTQLKSYAKNEYFAKEGDRPNSLAFVCSGVFRAFYRNTDGVEYNKTFFTDNTFMIALTAIVTKNTNLINIQALLDSVVLELDYQKFTRLFDVYQILERLVRKIIESEWAKKETREIRLVIDDATARYMYFREEHPGLETKIPQYHIASYLGITPIQLSRIRSKLISR